MKVLSSYQKLKQEKERYREESSKYFWIIKQLQIDSGALALGVDGNSTLSGLEEMLVPIKKKELTAKDLLKMISDIVI